MKTLASMLRPALCALAVLVVTGPLAAATNPADAISENAAVVIRLKQPDRTIQKAVDLLNRLQPGLGGLLQAQANSIGVLISNPTLAGVDKQKDWYVAAFPRKKGQPGVLFAIPATDVGEFQKALGDQFQSFAKDGVVFYSDDADTVEQAKKCLESGGATVTSAMDAHAKELFEAGDLSVFVNAKVLKEVYAERLQRLKDQAKTGLKELEKKLAETEESAQAKTVADLAKQVAAVAFQVLDDTESFTSAVSVGKDGLVTECYLHVTPESPTDRFLESNPPQELKMLSALPTGKLAYVGGKLNQLHFLKWVIKLVRAAGAAASSGEASSETADAWKDAEQALERFSQLKMGEMVSYFELGDLTTGLIRGGTVMEVDRPKEWLEAYLQFARLSPKLSSVPGVRQKFEVQRDAEKYGQYSGTVVKVRVEYDESRPEVALAKKFTDALYGPGGSTVRIVCTKDKVYLTLGGGKQDMVNLLAAFEQKKEARTSSRSASSHVAVLQKYFAQTNLVGLVDLPNIVLKVAKVVVEGGVLPIPIDPQMLSGMSIEPSYLGFGLATEKDGLTLKLVVPAEQFRGIAQLVTFGQQIFLQMQMQQMQEMQEEEEPLLPQ